MNDIVVNFDMIVCVCCVICKYKLDVKLDFEVVECSF